MSPSNNRGDSAGQAVTLVVDVPGVRGPTLSQLYRSVWRPQVGYKGFQVVPLRTGESALERSPPGGARA